MLRDTFEFTAGPLIGRTVRVDLTEMQSPEINRKTSTPMAEHSVDRIERRPLDPPPVVRLRLFEIENEGTPHEHVTEIDASSSFAYSGFVCHIDLFPIKEPAGFKGPRPMKQWSDDAPSFQALLDLVQRDEKQLDELKCTERLFGCTVVNAVQIKDLRNEPCSVFVFGDISVRTEGHFVLRYRCFDIFSSTSPNQVIPICAETWSTPFVVVGTKEFPGLKASTQLTRHLSNYGIPVNWRGMGRSQAQINAEARKGREEAQEQEEEASPPLPTPSRAGYSGRSPLPPHPERPATSHAFRPRSNVSPPQPPVQPARSRTPAAVGPPAFPGYPPPPRPALPASRSYSDQFPRLQYTGGQPTRPSFPSLTQQVPEVDTRGLAHAPMPPPPHFGPPPPADRHTSMPARMPPPPRPPYDTWDRRGDPNQGPPRRGKDQPERRY